jgi:hypothetical protein
VYLFTLWAGRQERAVAGQLFFPTPKNGGQRRAPTNTENLSLDISPVIYLPRPTTAAGPVKEKKTSSSSFVSLFRQLSNQIK